MKKAEIKKALEKELVRAQILFEGSRNSEQVNYWKDYKLGILDRLTNAPKIDLQTEGYIDAMNFKPKPTKIGRPSVGEIDLPPLRVPKDYPKKIEVAAKKSNKTVPQFRRDLIKAAI